MTAPGTSGAILAIVAAADPHDLARQLYAENLALRELLAAVVPPENVIQPKTLRVLARPAYPPHDGCRCHSRELGCPSDVD